MKKYIIPLLCLMVIVSLSGCMHRHHAAPPRGPAYHQPGHAKGWQPAPPRAHYSPKQVRPPVHLPSPHRR